MEGVQAAMTTRNLEPDKWRNREEWRLVSGRQRQLLKTPDRWIDNILKRVRLSNALSVVRPSISNVHFLHFIEPILS
jgi:hypothetical protein